MTSITPLPDLHHRALTVRSWVLMALTPVGFLAAFWTLLSTAALLDVGLGRAAAGQASLWAVAVVVIATCVVGYAAPTLAAVLAIRAVAVDEPGSHAARVTAFIVLGITVIATFLLGWFGLVAGIVAVLIVALQSYRATQQSSPR